MIPLVFAILIWGELMLWARMKRAEAEYELLKRALTRAGIDPYGK